MATSAYGVSLPGAPPEDAVTLLAREVLIHGPITRAELGRRLGVSAPTLTRLTRPLLESGVIVEAPEATVPAFGRPSRPLDVPATTQRYLGIMTTSDRLYGILTDVRARPVAEESVPLADVDPAHVVSTLAGLVERLRGDSALNAVGVAIGGFAREGRIVVSDAFLGWTHVPLADLVEQICGAPVFVENNVVALAEAEHWFGAARGIDDFAVITVGAGVGYGLVQHGRQIIGARTGEGAHVPLDASPERCGDGHPGCSSALLATSYLCSSVAERLGRPVSAAALSALVRTRDPAAAEVMALARRRLVRLLTMSASLAMVDAVVLAGEGLELFLADGEIADLGEDWPETRSAPRILLDRSGFVSWARGAAAVAVQHHFAVSART